MRYTAVRRTDSKRKGYCMPEPLEWAKQGVLIVGNPISGRTRVGQYINAVTAAVRGLGTDARVVTTGGPGDAERAAAEFDGGCILAFGGDGTFNEVLNGAHLDRCVLGIIPMGTGNVLGKELRMPRRPLRAVRALADARVVEWDLPVCNGRRFASMVGAGLDAHIVNRVHRRRKGGLTQFHYVAPMLGEAVKPTRWDIRVEVDGEVLIEEGNVVVVGNVRSYGGPIEMTSKADPTDGLLDVMAVRVRNPAELTGPVIGCLTRMLHAFPGVRYKRGRTIRLSAERGDVPWQMDGDSAGELPVEISVEPGRLKLLAPARYGPRRPARGSVRGPVGK